jgi:hypothetical protein
MRRRIHVCPKGSHEDEDTCVSKGKSLGGGYMCVQREVIRRRIHVWE